MVIIGKIIGLLKIIVFFYYVLVVADWFFCEKKVNRVKKIV